MVLVFVVNGASVEKALEHVSKLINNQSAADITAYCVAGPADSVGVQHLPVRCDTTLTGS